MNIGKSVLSNGVNDGRTGDDTPHTHSFLHNHSDNTTSDDSITCCDYISKFKIAKKNY